MSRPLLAVFYGGPCDGRIQQFANAGDIIEFPAYVLRENGDGDFYSVRYRMLRELTEPSDTEQPTVLYVHEATPVEWLPR